MSAFLYLKIIGTITYVTIANSVHPVLVSRSRSELGIHIETETWEKFPTPQPDQWKKFDAQHDSVEKDFFHMIIADNPRHYILYLLYEQY